MNLIKNFFIFWYLYTIFLIKNIINKLIKLIKKKSIQDLRIQHQKEQKISD